MSNKSTGNDVDDVDDDDDECAGGGLGAGATAVKEEDVKGAWL